MSTDRNTAPSREEEELIQQTLDAAFSQLPAGLTPQQGAAAAGRVFRNLAKQPMSLLKHGTHLALEGARILAGTSDVTPDAGDRRFNDEWFDRNPLYHRAMQQYLAWNREVYGLLDDLELDPKSRERARFLLAIFTEAVAPTNVLLGNPAALKKAIETRGQSLISGLKHAFDDLRHNGGMPSMVDTRPFVYGETIAATPGSVVFQNDILELIQYTPTTKKVHARPLIISPPQINKFYVLDLAPGRSLVEYAVSQGQQVFMVSWRNPTKAHRDWDMDSYVTALLEGVDAAREITGSEDVNVLGVCAGGMTVASMLSYLASTGDPRVNVVSFLVTVLDWSKISAMTTFVSEPMLSTATQTSAREGVLSGSGLKTVFAWLRPNDLVWNYWVNNYLMGQDPPAFDVLAWNVDATNLPAGLHKDFMHMASTNALTKDGEFEVLGHPVNLAKVDLESFVIGAINDHITPWQGCYETTRLLGGESQFVLSTAGHVVAMVNPPGGKKSSYMTNADGAGLEPEEWKATAVNNEGSWWPYWLEWLSPRSGDEVPAPASTGSKQHPVIAPAPGSYVRD